MQHYLFFFEYLNSAFWFFQAFFLHFLQPPNLSICHFVFLLAFLSITYLKIRIEGSRLNIFLFLIFEPILLYTSSLILSLSLIGLTLLQIPSSKVYKFPATIGQFYTGLRTLKLENNLNLAVLYPTLQQTVDTTFSENFSILDRAHEAILKRFPLPKFVLYLAFSFIKHLKLGVNLNAQIASPSNTSASNQLNGAANSNKKFPVIIFNHALATNNMIYMSFFREWTSKGYVVFSIDTDEVLLTPHQGPADPVRFIQIENRFKQFEQVLDLVTDKTKYQKVLESNEVEIDENRIFVAGHSFGGAAACLTAYRSQKVTGCILLDPWLWPLDNGLLETPMNKPVLVIRSETYYDRNKEMKLYQKLEVMIKANSKKEVSLSCYFEGTGHSSPSDLVFFIPGLLKGQGVQENNIEVVLDMSNGLIDMFMREVEKSGLGLKVKKDVDANLVKEDVIQRFRQVANKKRQPSLLKIDSF